jgi:hypothetical protein
MYISLPWLTDEFVREQIIQPPLTFSQFPYWHPQVFVCFKSVKYRSSTSGRCNLVVVPRFNRYPHITLLHPSFRDSSVVLIIMVSLVGHLWYLSTWVHSSTAVARIDVFWSQRCYAIDNRPVLACNISFQGDRPLRPASSVV